MLKQTGNCFYDCPVCGSKNSMSWQSDFDFEDAGYEGQGIITLLTCMKCGTDVEIRAPIESEGQSWIYG